MITREELKYQWEVWTNVPFMLVGAYMMFEGLFLWGLGVLFMGAGSFFGHATGKFRLDWAGMWMCYTIQLGYFLALITGLTFTFSFLGVAFGVALWIFTPQIKGYFKRIIPNAFIPGHYFLLGLFYLAGAIMALPIVGWSTALASGVLYAIGFFIRQRFDHGTWHIIIALAIAVLAIPIIKLGL